MKRIVLALFLAVVGLAAWQFRGPLLSAILEWRSGRVAAEPPTPELAAAADGKLAALAGGEREIIALSGTELQSLLMFQYAQVLPAFVDSPRIEIRNDRLRVRGRVSVDRLSAIRELGNAARFLPDTTELAVAGQLLPLGDGRIALGIDEISASRIPLPRRIVPSVLRQLGRVDEPGLPEDALALPLPNGATTAYLRGDSLYLRRGGRVNP
jgi:hypothetical protein